MVEADRALVGAPVLTQDPDRPEAEAVAFRHGRVLEVGDRAEVEPVVGPGTEVHELEPTQLVLPGFVDAHTHAARLGEMHWRQDLAKAETRDQAVQILAQIAERTPEDGWVVAWNWDESAWPEREPLTCEHLDAASGTRKILARRVCGHRAVVNTPGLEALDLDDVHGVETEAGGPTGTLVEEAAEEAWEQCAPAFRTCARGLANETERLARLGITTVADTAGPRDVRLLSRGVREGFFDQRAHLYLRDGLVEHAEALQVAPLVGEACSLLGVKTYVDGSVGARTAAVGEAYEDEDTTGDLLRSAEDVAELAERVHANRLQLKAHAIGDRAIDAVLDGVEAAGLPPEARPRIEHAELLRDDQIDRMAELGVVCCMQPNFVANWQGEGELYEQALGRKRALSMNPMQSVLESDVPLAFGSDGMPYGPVYGIRAAVEHPDPDQRLPLEAALAAYTRGAAHALGREDELGILREGALGDAVVLDRDPRSSDLGEVGVAVTVRGGELLHAAG